MIKTRSEKHKLKIKIIFITIFCILLLTIIAGAFFYSKNNKNTNAKENEIFYTKIKTDKSPQENFDNNKKFDYSVSGEMIYKNGVLNLVVQNKNYNK